jgi:transcriptional regulator with XRE-family HTH domain
MTLNEQIVQLAEQHGSLRAVAEATGIGASYLSRLASGEKTEPSDEVLRKLGLRRVVTYELIGRRK